MDSTLQSNVPRRAPARVALTHSVLLDHCQDPVKPEHHRARWLVVSVALTVCFAAGAAAATGLGWFSKVAPTPVSARTTVAANGDWSLVSWDSSRGLCVGLELPKGGGATSCGLRVGGPDGLAAAVSYVDATAGDNFLFGLVDPRTDSANARLAGSGEAPVDLFSDRQGHRFFLIAIAPSQTVTRLDLAAAGQTRLGTWDVPNVSGRIGR